jgi:hypothetical protein
VTRALEIAWAGGLFEGEGTITLVGSKYKQPSLRLGMVDLDIVERFRDVVGVGAIYTERRPAPRQDLYRWVTNRRSDCLRVVSELWPHLGDRRRARALEVLPELASAYVSP